MLTRRLEGGPEFRSRNPIVSAPLQLVPANTRYLMRLYVMENVNKPHPKFCWSSRLLIYTFKSPAIPYGAHQFSLSLKQQMLCHSPGAGMRFL